MVNKPKCPICKEPAKLVSGDKIYPHRPDLKNLNFWKCSHHETYVGCHRAGYRYTRDGESHVSDGTHPLGTMADNKLRQMRSNLHNGFDWIWKDGELTRGEAYQMLSDLLKIHIDDCHFAMFDESRCRKASAIIDGMAIHDEYAVRVKLKKEGKPLSQDTTKSDENRLIVYADGACKGNPGVGGWGAILVWNGVKKVTKEIFGGDKNTTNNRMELMAVIESLKLLNRPCKIEMRLDSSYVLNGIEKWLPAWKNRGWITASKQPVKNDDLWKTLDNLCQPHDIKWTWVKGHSGNWGNEKADELANKGVKAIRESN